MPDVSGGPVVTNARAFYTTRAAAGALSARHFLRPHLFGRSCLQTSDVSRRENASVYLLFEKAGRDGVRENYLLRHSGMREAQARNPYAL